MEKWVGVTVILCLYGGVKEIRPSTHYLTQYLEGPQINLTHGQVNNEVYPVWTYSYLCFLPVIFICTVIVRYKPVIVLEALALVITWCLLIWGRGLSTMQLMQVIFGLATSADIAYYTYIYTQVPKTQFMRVTSYVRAAVWAGKLTSATLAQVLISAHVMSFFTLNFISLGCVAAAMFVSLTLPASEKVLYQPDNICKVTSSANHECKQKDPEGERMLQPVQLTLTDNLKTSNRDTCDETTLKTTPPQSYHSVSSWSNTLYFCKVLSLLWQNVKDSYSNTKLIRWSIWYAFGLCGNLQVGNFVQPLWEEIYPAAEHEEIYHGAADAVKTFVAMLVILGLGHIKVDWSHHGELTLGLVSSLEASLLFIMSQSGSIWLAYGAYCVYSSSHQMLTTITSYLVAKGLNPDLHPLIFGLNTFLALILNSVLTLIVVDKRGLSLSPRVQFVIYAGYFMILGSIFLIITLLKVIRSYMCHIKPQEIGVSADSPANHDLNL